MPTDASFTLSSSPVRTKEVQARTYSRNPRSSLLSPLPIKTKATGNATDATGTGVCLSVSLSLILSFSFSCMRSLCPKTRLGFFQNVIGNRAISQPLGAMWLLTCFMTVLTLDRLPKLLAGLFLKSFNFSNN